MNALEITFLFVYFTMFSPVHSSGNVFETWEKLTYIFIYFPYYARV
jgi:hypothetical protein